MPIKIELQQTWETISLFRNYIGMLDRLMEKIGELGDEAPTEWYLEVRGNEDKGYTVSLTSS